MYVQCENPTPMSTTSWYMDGQLTWITGLCIGLLAIVMRNELMPETAAGVQVLMSIMVTLLVTALLAFVQSKLRKK